MPWKNTQALLGLKQKVCLCVLTPSPALLTDITQNAYKAHEEAPIQMVSRKMLSYPFSRTPANLSLELKEETKYWVHWHNLHICLGFSPKSLQCYHSHRTGSGSCKGFGTFWVLLSEAAWLHVIIYQACICIYLRCGPLPDRELKLSLTYPPTTERVSATRLLKQKGSFKSQLAFVATLY